MDAAEGSVYYQITHDRRVRLLETVYKIRSDEWDDQQSMVVTGRDIRRYGYVQLVRDLILHDMERIMRVESKLQSMRLDYSIDDVIYEFLNYSNRYSLFKYMTEIIEKLRVNGKVRTSETYRAALNSFRHFLGQTEWLSRMDDIILDCLDSSIMESYEAWLRGRGISPNTISFYNRILRAVYNRAVDNNIIEDKRPFRHVYTGVGRTVKRALPLSDIKKIRTMNLSHMPTVDYARDMFMLSFYLRGMSFVDMAFLRKTDLRHGYVTYQRRKTGQSLTIAWTEEMQQILDKYPPNPTCYLLPVIRNRVLNERCAYRNTGYNINRGLKKLARMTGLSQSLTLYCARHSWASVAKHKGIPIGVISQGLGHDSESTTRIYLASLDTTIVDKANSLIMSSI